MSRRGSNKGWTSTGKLNISFASPGFSEVHSLAATHKVLAMEEDARIRRIHDMEAPQPPQDPSPMFLVQQLSWLKVNSCIGNWIYKDITEDKKHRNSPTPTRI